MNAPQGLTGAVLVVLNGTLLASAPPAHVAAGRVVVPAAAVARLADRMSLDATGTLHARRGTRECSAKASGAAELVELAPLARCLGAHVSWDARTKSLSLALATPAAAVTHAPYDPNAPRVLPTTIFTPEPPPPTPRVIVTGVPRPRRTAIPVTPSFPLTNPRP